VGLNPKVLIKFGAALVAIASVVGCGSGGGAGQSFMAPGSSAASAPAASSNPGATTTSQSSAPASAAQAPAGTVIANIQSQSGWQTCGGCGNVGGTGQGPDYHITQGISSPSLSGSAADFYVNGGPAYTGGYYFIEQPTLPNPISYLQYDFDLYIPAQYVDAPQAIEFEIQQTVNGNTYNYAWQADYVTNSWFVFNYTTKTWEPSGIPLQRFAPDTWHRITAVFHAAGTQAVHDSLAVDGQTHNVNIAHEATQTGTRLEFTTGFQVDLNSTSTPYHVYVDNMKVTVAD
jgi:hypothetical protein